MIRIERIERRAFFQGWTPGFCLGVLLYLAGIASLFFLGRHTGSDLTPCLLHQASGIPCPLCGGTTASFFLVTGRIRDALLANPLVTVAIPLAFTWLVLRLGFGVSVRPSFSPALFAGGIAGIVLIHWAYVLSTR